MYKKIFSLAILWDYKTAVNSGSESGRGYGFNELTIV